MQRASTRPSSRAELAPWQVHALERVLQAREHQRRLWQPALHERHLIGRLLAGDDPELVARLLRLVDRELAVADVIDMEMRVHDRRHGQRHHLADRLEDPLATALERVEQQHPVVADGTWSSKRSAGSSSCAASDAAGHSVVSCCA